MTPEQFLTKLGQHFRHQHDNDETMAGWVEDAIAALTGFRPDVLASAAKSIIRDRESPWFPTVGECTQACRMAILRLPTVRTAADAIKAADQQWPEPTEEQREMGNALVAEFKRNVAAKSLYEDAKKLPDVSRQSFEKMMRESPNQELYLDKKTLTDRSRRMMGDDA